MTSEDDRPLGFDVRGGESDIDSDGPGKAEGGANKAPLATSAAAAEGMEDVGLGCCIGCRCGSC